MTAQRSQKCPNRTCKIVLSENPIQTLLLTRVSTPYQPLIQLCAGKKVMGRRKKLWIWGHQINSLSI